MSITSAIEAKLYPLKPGIPYLPKNVQQFEASPHIPVWDKSERTDGTFSRSDFTFDRKHNVYVCLAGKLMTTSGRMIADNGIRYFAPCSIAGPVP